MTAAEEIADIRRRHVAHLAQRKLLTEAPYIDKAVIEAARAAFQENIDPAFAAGLNRKHPDDHAAKT